jgi:hypothetical protein
MGTMTTISRRQFIVSSAAFGGGMALGVVSADSADAAFLGPVPRVETDALRAPNSRHGFRSAPTTS